MKPKKSYFRRDDQYAEVRDRALKGMRFSDIASDLNIPYETVRKIVKVQGIMRVYVTAEEFAMLVARRRENFPNK